VAAPAPPRGRQHAVHHGRRVPGGGKLIQLFSPTDIQVPYFNFPEDEADFDLVNDCIRAARSIVGLYNLPTNGKTLEDKITVVAQAKNARERAMLESQAPIIVALTKGAGQALFVTEDSEVPAGCGTETVTADINIHIVVKGKVDASAEIGKLEKKAVFAEQGRDKVVKMTQQTNYETTIPENVRAQNTEKIAKYEAEIDALRQAMERFKILL
jgi:valyl-tRNA synthetase